MFDMSADNFTKQTYKIVVGKSWVITLWKTDTRQKICRMKWTATAMIMYVLYFLFLLFELSG